MVKMLCAIVGASGSAFSMDINKRRLVGHLKDVIKVKKFNACKDVDADKLQLFLAKTIDGGWLKDDDLAALELERGKLHQDIQRMLDTKMMMMAEKTIQHWLFDRNTMPQPSTGQLHVLVVVPEQDAKATMSPPRVLLPRATALSEPEQISKECISLEDWGVLAVHKIPLIQKFMSVPSIWESVSELDGSTTTGEMYWRMEDKKVVALVMDGWFRESSSDNVNYLAEKRSIVMGSSGIGKSTLLCVMAFYLVFKHKKNVLVYRKLAFNEKRLFYLGYENDKVVQFTMPNCYVQNATDIYKELVRRHGRSNVWLLLDGFRYRDIPEGMRTFKLLTTAHRVDLLPQEQEGGLIHGFVPEIMEKRYYYSGGSARGFTRALLDDIRNEIDCKISNVGDVSKLLSNKFRMLWADEVDCLCHTFWIDPTKPFIYVENWVQVIDSEYAVNAFQIRLGSVALSTIYKWAKSSGNTSLAQTAFKLYLHRLAIDNTLELHMSEYDQSIKRKPKDSRPLQVERVQLKKGRATCSGTASAHMRELIRWRDDARSSYWFPKCQDFLNIDSIVKLESGNVAYLRFSVAADEKIYSKQLHQINAIFSAAANAEPPIYIGVCPDLKSCEALVLNPQSEAFAAKKVCRVYVGYYC